MAASQTRVTTSDRAARLRQESDGAYQLLQYAVEMGTKVPDDVRLAITSMKETLDASGTVAVADEIKFQEAYTQLATSTRPVTAQSLQDTDDTFGKRNWLRAALRVSQISEAKAFSHRFASLALVAILLIAGAEFGQNFARSVISNQQEAVKVNEEKRKSGVTEGALERQLQTIPAGGDAGQAVQRENVLRQLGELRAQRESLDERFKTLTSSAQQGYRILSLGSAWWYEKLPHLIVPLSTSVGGILLPLLYGILGACAYNLRSVLLQMHERSFEWKRVGDYGTRVYLGMVSGVTLQWLIVGAGRDTPGALTFTPAVLGFVGGYSVEIVFTVVDEIIKRITAAVRAVGK